MTEVVDPEVPDEVEAPEEAEPLPASPAGPGVAPPEEPTPESEEE